MCKVEGCKEKVSARGWCKHHYQSWYRYGDPLKAKYGHAGEANGRYRDGQSQHPLYHVWRQMIQRCHNPDHNRYADYGGRGIYVCDRWRKDFRNYLIDVGKDYEEGLWLDRIDNNGPYTSDNCHWIEPKESNLNKRGYGWENRSRDIEGRFE